MITKWPQPGRGLVLQKLETRSWSEVNTRSKILPEERKVGNAIHWMSPNETNNS